VNTQLDDLLGSLTASGDTFRFKHGLLATAIMDGALILLDEVNLLPTDVQTALLPFLSGAREIELGDGIFDARRVLFAATMNPVTFGIILWLA
jgi:Mg-chelatase subunit ChlI